jgi:hypothetical protein
MILIGQYDPPFDGVRFRGAGGAKPPTGALRPVKTLSEPSGHYCAGVNHAGLHTQR